MSLTGEFNTTVLQVTAQPSRIGRGGRVIRGGGGSRGVSGGKVDEEEKEEVGV